VKVLGLDPGYGRLGWALVEQKGFGLSALAYGTHETPARMAFGDRLRSVHDFTAGLVEKHRPDEAAVEQLFFSKNVKTALMVAQARGVLLLALHGAGVPLVEISPQHVKSSLAGYGAAKKPQVQAMVQRLLKLSVLPADDAADALGLALTALRTRPLRQFTEKLKSRSHAVAGARP
jgi:crossover junction endodeoxyribonuclease RuvC